VILPADLSLTFFSVAVLLGLSPGPDNLFVLSQSALYGRAAGLAVVLGLSTGLVVHTLAVALGLAALLAASETALVLLRYAGAAYLLALAWQAWRSGPPELDGLASSAGRLPALYWRGVLMNLSNPKVLLFFLALLPQFTRPELGDPVLQIAWLGALFVLATVLVFGAIAVLAARLGTLLRRHRAVRDAMPRATALLLAGLALVLLLN
jgi:threonine/homoserine/homoserine lactone efflux protein